VITRYVTLASTPAVAPLPGGSSTGRPPRPVPCGRAASRGRWPRPTAPVGRRGDRAILRLSHTGSGPLRGPRVSGPFRMRWRVRPSARPSTLSRPSLRSRNIGSVDQTKCPSGVRSGRAEALASGDLVGGGDHPRTDRGPPPASGTGARDGTRGGGRSDLDVGLLRHQRMMPAGAVPAKSNANRGERPPEHSQQGRTVQPAAAPYIPATRSSAVIPSHPEGARRHHTREVSDLKMSAIRNTTQATNAAGIPRPIVATNAPAASSATTQPRIVIVDTVGEAGRGPDRQPVTTIVAHGLSPPAERADARLIASDRGAHRPRSGIGTGRSAEERPDPNQEATIRCTWRQYPATLPAADGGTR
jgi:hypothetical protein